MNDILRIQKVLEQIKYKDWTFGFWVENGRPLMRVQFQAPCSESGNVEFQKGRKWFLSPHMTKSEIVATAFKAVITAEEHETRENFKYRKVSVFSPHYDVDFLVSAQSVNIFDTRGEINA